MKKALFKLARSRVASSFIGFAFAHITALMPLNRLFEDADCILFLHPVPHWETHWLGVPKARISQFLDLTTQADWRHTIAILRSLSHLVSQHNINQSTILVNGGAYQDVPQMHFHMAEGSTKQGEDWVDQSYFERGIEDEAVEMNQAVAWRNQQTDREFGWQISAETASPLHSIDWGNSAETSALIDLLKLTQQLVKTHQPDGWTLQFHHDADNPDSRLTAHLIGAFNS